MLDTSECIILAIEIGIILAIITEMFQRTTLVQIYYSLCQTLLNVRAVQ